MLWNSSFRRCFLCSYDYMNRAGAGDVYERIGQISHSFKASLSGNSGGVHCIGDSAFNGIHVAGGARDSQQCRVRGYRFNSVSRRQRPDHSRPHWHLAGRPRIKNHAQAAGSHLHDFDLMRNLDMVGCKVIGVLAGNCALQIDCGMHSGLCQFAQHARGAAKADLRLRNYVRRIIEVLWRMRELNRHHQ